MNDLPGGTDTAATETRTSAPAPAAPRAAAATTPATSPPPSATPPGTALPRATPPGATPPSTARSGTAQSGTAQSGTSRSEPLYGGRATRRVTVSDLAKAKARGEKWPMLTAYDALTAHVFDEAGIPVLLVGDSAGMVVFGHDTTIPVTLDELIPLTAAVVRGTSRALIVADLPFGSYQASPGAALAAGIRFLKEAGAHAVKLEGGRRVVAQAEELVAAGIPVMGHLGLTPQSVNVFGGYRVQGRGEDGEQLLQDAKALETAGAFAVVLECVPAELAARVTDALSIPTIGIGAGPDCDAQVLVWQDMAGLSPRTAKFVKRYADVAGVLGRAAQAFADEVVGGQFPTGEHSYR
jgi:3-methyl-2-oxobutanoate hydroxymethyltransferase